ncbi:hypothetical protein LEP1GSC047_1560 [Leptospira inadai serovar Lyme str. 10]|uniref:Hydrolase, carbon-nitrogen family n=2 Tax=Leptospira inadai serovar Lyme TaxID=293084 RepID=V6H941_9LEPT|nr:hypothetical protein [Leptospira inadai]EQA35377.1 hypothetical protein LEP1GSC047_1560 [Leptospira inadai serovar Lyme str. 10]PNV75427.1 hypothetical protein BES34_009280 [Leptospira inadai serovar Lyme]
MNPFWRNAIASLFLIPIFLGIGWLLSGKTLGEEDFISGLPQNEIGSYSSGFNRKSGNILLLQLEFKPEYYSKEDRLRTWLEKPLIIAKENGWLDKSTVVVYPPEIGNYLFLIGRRSEVFQAESEIGSWKRTIFFTRISYDGLRNGLLFEDEIAHFLAKISAERYRRIFGTLSKTYGVTIVAGSIILPSPKIAEDLISIGPGNWEERSYLFTPDGKLYNGSLKRTKFKDGSLSSYLSSQSDRIESEVWTIPFHFAKLGFLYGEEFGPPEMEDIVRKTFVTRWIALGSPTEEGKFREWISKSNFETSGEISFFGKAWDRRLPGTSFIKTRYGIPEPKESGKGTVLLNIYL